MFLIDLAEKIEETRYKVAKVVESFLLRRLFYLKSKFVEVLSHRFSSLYCAFFIVGLSIFVRSFRDLGHDSAAVIDVTKMILQGKKYYFDFIENNLPLFFYFNSIPVLFSELFGVSPLIAVSFWSNVVGVSGIYFSSKILKKSDVFKKDNLLFNLIIIGFFAGYFLRVFTIAYDEFGTKSSYFLVFLYVYFSYFLVEDKYLKKSDEIVIGVIAALLFCLKPHYGLIVVAVEIYKIFKKKDFFSAFCLRNYISLGVICSYLLLIIFCYPELISNISNLSEIYFRNKSSGYYVFGIVVNDYFPIFLTILLIYCFISRDVVLEKMLFFSLIAALTPVLEITGGLDQRFISYSIFLPVALVSLVYLVRYELINIRKHWILVFVCFFVFWFDFVSIFGMLVWLVYFWWVLVLVDIFYYKRQIIKDIFSWSCFLVMVLFSLFSLFNTKLNEFGWFLGALSLVYYILVRERNNKSELSLVSAFVIFTVISHLFFSYFVGVVGSKKSLGFKLKTPNYVSDQFFKIINEKGGKFVMISDGIYNSYPIRKFVKVNHHIPLVLSYDALYNFWSNSKNRYEAISSQNQYLLDLVKKQIQDVDNNIIFVRKEDVCKTGLLEFYFGDLEFKKLFLDNYEFYNRVIDIEEYVLDKNRYFGEFYEEENIRNLRIIKGDYEVYIRKK